MKSHSKPTVDRHTGTWRSRFGTATRVEALEPRTLLAFAPLGPEFVASQTTAGDQVWSAVAADAKGNFVVAWESDGQDGDAGGIYARRFDAAGNPLGNEFRVNTTTAGDQEHPAVAMDPSGAFVITWDVYAAGNGVYAQRFDAGGARVGGEFRVLSSATGSGLQSSVAANASGAFAIAWRGTGTSSSDQGAFVRRYAANGTPAGPAVRLPTDGRTVTGLSVALDDAGRVAVAYSKYIASGTGTAVPDVFLQRFDASGALAGTETRVNQYTDATQEEPTIAVDRTTGRLVVAYTDSSNVREGPGGGAGVYARLFNPDGTPVGDEFRANTTLPGDQRPPDAAVAPDGSFVIAWHGPATDRPADPGEIYFQRFDASGKPLDGETHANTIVANNQYVPAVAFGGDGRLTVAWHSSGGNDGSGFGVYARRYADVDTTPPTVTGLAFRYAAVPRPAIEVQFSEPLGASPSAQTFRLTNLGTGADVPSASLAVHYDAAAARATVTFDGLPGGVLPDGNYRFVVPAGSVSDKAGNSLAADAVLDFYVLVGDANRDRVVNFSDLLVLAKNYNGTGKTWADGDFDGNGIVNFSDLLILAKAYNKALPAPVPVVAPPAATASVTAPVQSVLKEEKPTVFSNRRVAPPPPLVSVKPKPKAVARPAAR